MLENLKRVFRYLFRNPPKAKVTLKVPTERHGSVYGGWNIIKNSLNHQSIVYSFGIGEDISFDVSIIERYNCMVYGYDPTPRVKKWIEEYKNLPKEFIFHSLGLANKDGELTFYLPVNDSNVSHTTSATGSQKTIKVICSKLETIMRENCHAKIDLLKMDIEGFEIDVIKDIVSSNIKIDQLLVEFHHFFPDYGNSITEELIKLLEKNNFRLFNVSNSFCEYSFKYVG